MNEDLRLAFELADISDAITLRHFRTSFAVRTKADRTPVSEVDEAVERAIRVRLQRERPDDAIVGEEFGTTGNAARRWIIDPIDATKNYIRGIPVFATLIALDGGGQPPTAVPDGGARRSSTDSDGLTGRRSTSVAVISAPALQRRWSAVRGERAACNGQPIQVSSVQSLAEAQIGYDSISDFDSAGLSEKFLALLRRCGRGRGFGDFWSHMLVAEGAMEIAIEPSVSWWDMAAVQIIVEEAGGRFSTLDGRPRADGGSGVSTNGRLHDEALAALR